MENPLKYFAELRDPGVERNREHLLEEVLLIAIAAVLSGAESWNDIADYGEAKLEWLKTFLTLPSGIPSQPGLCGARSGAAGKRLRGLGQLDRQADPGEVAAIDGNALRGRINSRSFAMSFLSAFRPVSHRAPKEFRERSPACQMPNSQAELQSSGTASLPSYRRTASP